MLTTTSVALKDSISTKLLQIVFSIYFLVALTVTIVHMAAEFFNTKKEILHDLQVFQNSYESVLAKAVWDIDQASLQVAVRGILQLPGVIGIKIQDKSGAILFAAGKTLDEAGQPQIASADGQLAPLAASQPALGLFAHQFALTYSKYGNPVQIGSGAIYSSTEVVIQKVQYGFVFIVINAVVKTLALWAIFLWAGRRFLSRPLSILTQVAEQLNLEKLENLKKVDVQTTGRNELKILEETFNAMVQKLILSKSRLQEAERVKMEVATAHTVQELLIPKVDPQLAEVEIASYYHSASETGGDWYNYRYYPDLHTLDILIGDVTGHGVPAALITAMANSIYKGIEEQRLFAKEVPGIENPFLHPEYFLRLWNNVLYKTTQGSYTMSLFYSVLDLQKKSLVYLSAAHNPCLIWRPSQFTITVKEGVEKRRSIRALHSPGSLLGRNETRTNSIQTIQLQADDVIIWYTDGLIENENPAEEPFGSSRLKKVLNQSAGLTAHQIKDQIIAAAHQHYAGQPYMDDVTLIVARMK